MINTDVSHTDMSYADMSDTDSSSPVTPVLEAHNISRVFQQGTQTLQVLKDLQLTVQRGESLAIVGASGSGKSTLLQILGGLDRPSAGCIRILGQDLGAMDEASCGLLRNRTMGFIYQFHHLLPEFTALENVAMPWLLRRASPAEARERAARLLGEVGLGERLDHKPYQLSGGERQRAAVARALVTEPAIVFADEPTGNLDGHNAAQVFELLLALRRERGTSLIVVTHDLQLAAKLDRQLRLVDGKLVI
jgi:lipoprotein-releasing system ATP-binding protein